MEEYYMVNSKESNERYKKFKESNKGFLDALDHICDEWLMSKDEKTYLRVRGQSGGSRISVLDDVYEAISEYIEGNGEFVKDDFILEFCEFLKNENLDLYERLISKLVGDFVFNVVNAYSVSK
jgi:predicted CopG family antitoxin